jgi:hypothetical protein
MPRFWFTLFPIVVFISAVGMDKLIGIIVHKRNMYLEIGLIFIILFSSGILNTYLTLRNQSHLEFIKNLISTNVNRPALPAGRIYSNETK